MYFSAGAEGRISYGHLGRTNLLYLDMDVNVKKNPLIYGLMHVIMQSVHV